MRLDVVGSHGGHIGIGSLAEEFPFRCVEEFRVNLDVIDVVHQGVSIASGVEISQGEAESGFL